MISKVTYSNITKVTIVILTGFLTGCGLTSEGDAVRAAVRDYGAKAADAELDNIVWGLCNAVSIGAVNRRYPAGSKKAAGREALCGE